MIANVRPHILQGSFFFLSPFALKRDNSERTTLTGINVGRGFTKSYLKVERVQKGQERNHSW